MFSTLYLDEDVSVMIKHLLTSRGHDVITTVEAGNRGASDAQQLAFAAAKGRAIVTHNHGDFEKLATEYIESERHHSGIIVACRRRPNEVAARLLVILENVPPDEMRDLLLYI